MRCFVNCIWNSEKVCQVKKVEEGYFRLRVSYCKGLKGFGLFVDDELFGAIEVGCVRGWG